MVESTFFVSVLSFYGLQTWYYENLWLEYTNLTWRECIFLNFLSQIIRSNNLITPREKRPKTFSNKLWNKCGRVKICIEKAKIVLKDKNKKYL